MAAEQQQIGRLAMRLEGESWNAYYALPDAMHQAIPLGSIRFAAIEGNKPRQAAFLDIMRGVVTDILKAKTGAVVTWPKGPQPAPEHERAPVAPPPPSAGALVTHKIAQQAANLIVKDGSDAGLSWSEMLVACETVIATVVAVAVHMAGDEPPATQVAMATEHIDVMTEGAHGRVVKLLQEGLT